MMKIAEYRETISKPLRQATLCFLVKEDKVLLAMKKRGFGQGRWNGVGGKVNPGETIEQAAIRETGEEIEVIPTDFSKVGILDFYVPERPDWDQQVVVFVVTSWEGEPKETEEMKPEWYLKTELPLEMWPDDHYWLPKVLAGKKIKAAFMFGENDKILDYSVEEVGVI